MNDPLLYHHPLKLRTECYPLGFPVSVATNSPDIAGAFEESWAAFPQRFLTEPLQIRAGVSDHESAAVPATPVVRAQGNLISFISDAENFAVADLTGGFGYSWVTPQTASTREFFRYHFLDSMVLTLLGAIHVSMIHAACVVLDGCGVLLCGESQAGKSSLAYACARSGWEYLSDDNSCLVRGRTDRTVVGNHRRLRLRPDAGRLFPEFREQAAKFRPNGKTAFEVATYSQVDIRTVFECQVGFVAFLERVESGPAAALNFDREVAAAIMADTMVLGSAHYRDERLAEFRHLLEVPVCRLRYSKLDDAVDCLTHLVRSN